jgi:predicted GNAT family acetyltransferase
MADPIRDCPERARFELDLGDGVAFIDYVRRGATLVLTHAEVPAALSGRGAGKRLVAATLEEVRRRGERVVPRCPFIARYIAEHPGYADLVAPSDGGAAATGGPL